MRNPTGLHSDYFRDKDFCRIRGHVTDLHATSPFAAFSSKPEIR